MLQFLPALILLLLQSQGYANRIGGEKVSPDLLSVGYRRSISQPTNRAVREVQRALLVRLLAKNSADPLLSGHLLDLLQAIDRPVASTPVSDREVEDQLAKNFYSPPDVLFPLTPLSSAQRFRDGPFSFV